MKKFLAYAAFVLFTAGTAVAETVRISHLDLPKWIEEKNDHTQSAKAANRAAEAQKGYLTRSFLPRLSLSGGYEVLKKSQESLRADPYVGIEAQVNLYRGGRDALQEEVQQKEALAAEARSQQSYLNELLEALVSYWTLVSEREAIVLLQQALEQNERFALQAKRRVEAGAAPETDRIEFELHKIQLGQDLAKAKSNYSQASRSLCVLLGLPKDTTFETASTIPDPSPGQSSSQSKVSPSPPAVVALQADRDMKAARHTLAKRWWIPSLAIYGGYALQPYREREFAALKDRLEGVVGVRLSVELFDGFSSSAESEAAFHQAESLRLQAAQTQREVEAQVANSSEELQTIARLIEEAKTGVAKVERYLQATLAQYQRGAKNSPDLLAASEKFLDLKRRYIDLKKDFHVAHAKGSNLKTHEY